MHSFDGYLTRNGLKWCVVQCLVKKDRGDLNDPSIAEFYEALVTAYKGPTLMPIQYPGSSDGRNSPLLLHAAQV
jgi:hypothetical protein